MSDNLLPMNVEPLVKWYLVLAAMTVIFLVLLIVERFSELRPRRHPFFKRLVINTVMSLLVFAAGTFVVAPSALRIVGWEGYRSIGLLNILNLPLWLHFTLGFLLLDLTFYWWHRINHVVPLLWRFHNVHHIDPDMDVTTSFRFHFVEVLYSTLFRVVQIAAIGISVETFFVYEFCFQANTMFHHSNVRLPISLERFLNIFIVTPRMHGIHHSAIREETNSNYSVVFRFWDYLHGTLLLNTPHSEITIGVPAYQAWSDNSLLRLLIDPFMKQRDYWLSSDGRLLIERQNRSFANKKMLAE